MIRVNTGLSASGHFWYSLGIGVPLCPRFHNPHKGCCSVATHPLLVGEKLRAEKLDSGVMRNLRLVTMWFWKWVQGVFSVGWSGEELHPPQVCLTLQWGLNKGTRPGWRTPAPAWCTACRVEFVPLLSGQMYWRTGLSSNSAEAYLWRWFPDCVTGRLCLCPRLTGRTAPSGWPTDLVGTLLCGGWGGWWKTYVETSTQFRM